MGAQRQHRRGRSRPSTDRATAKRGMSRLASARARSKLRGRMPWREVAAIVGAVVVLLQVPTSVVSYLAAKANLQAAGQHSGSSGRVTDLRLEIVRERIENTELRLEIARLRFEIDRLRLERARFGRDAAP